MVKINLGNFKKNNYPCACKCPNCQNVVKFNVENFMFNSKQDIKCYHCNSIFKKDIPDESVFKKIQSTGAGVGIKKETTPSKVTDGTFVGTETQKELELKIEVIATDETPQQFFKLEHNTMTIGRKNTSGPQFKPDIEIVTKDNFMSKIHAALLKKGKNTYALKDMESKNKTWHNDVELAPNDEIALNDGDIVRIGRTKLRICIKSDIVKNENKVSTSFPDRTFIE